MAEYWVLNVVVQLVIPRKPYDHTTSTVIVKLRCRFMLMRAINLRNYVMKFVLWLNVKEYTTRCSLLTDYTFLGVSLLYFIQYLL
jgi:hypothetical protein